jgi:hypothetical protein
VDVLMMGPLLSCDGNMNVLLMLKISEPVHCVPTTITSALFIGFGHMSNEWKVEEVNYEFDI